jgi:N-acylglucosamine 2-epimerase
MSIETYAKYWAENYKEDLTHNIMPFWLKNGLDKEHGGIYTCVARNGQLIDTTKSVWFQGRFAFICSYAYNNIEKNPEWLDAAKLTLDFIEKHCFDTDGRMYFEVAADGTPLRKRRYVFSESFAAIAIMRTELKRSSFNLWRKRVNSGISQKHLKKRNPEIERFKCTRQRTISLNKISKR